MNYASSRHGANFIVLGYSGLYCLQQDEISNYYVAKKPKSYIDNCMYSRWKKGRKKIHALKNAPLLIKTLHCICAPAGVSN